MGQVVGGRGAVAEDDDGFRKIRVCEQEHVEIVLAVRDLYLEKVLLERRWYG